MPLAKATLAECAEDYFANSEQVPTKVSLAVAEHSINGADTQWRSGGMLLQRIAGDEARGSTDDAWDEAKAIFGTLTDAELVDPDLSSDRLLYRLFHESGVRAETEATLRDDCNCNEARLKSTLNSMPDAQLIEMAEPDGTLSVDCQFWSRNFTIDLAEVTEG